MRQALAFRRGLTSAGASTAAASSVASGASSNRGCVSARAISRAVRRSEPQFVLGLTFGEFEDGSDPGVAIGRNEGARPLGDGVAWHVRLYFIGKLLLMAFEVTYSLQNHRFGVRFPVSFWTIHRTGLGGFNGNCAKDPCRHIPQCAFASKADGPCRNSCSERRCRSMSAGALLELSVTRKWRPRHAVSSKPDLRDSRTQV